MINLSVFGEFSSGSVQKGACRAKFSVEAEHSLVSNHRVLMI
jgi:hypothetical protein